MKKFKILAEEKEQGKKVYKEFILHSTTPELAIELFELETLGSAYELAEVQEVHNCIYCKNEEIHEFRGQKDNQYYRTFLCGSCGSKFSDENMIKQ